MAKVLLMDDQMTMVQMVSELLRTEGHQVFPFTNIQPNADTLATLQPELIIANVSTDRARALALTLAQKARSLNPPAVVILIIPAGALELAIDAMKKGVYDYLHKPFTLDELKLRVQRALSYRAALSENVFFRRQLQSKYQFSEIIGTSPTMLELVNVLERVSETDSPILLQGASGTGKELAARAVHFNSRRRFAPFISASCQHLPEHLLESELWGSRKSTVAGNVAQKPGLFLEADGGTVLLDHIDALSTSLQSRLVRIIQDKEVRRPGESDPIALDIRILAATEQSLEQKVAAGTFREDLYNDLKTFSVALPRLRDRLEDVPLLISHFLAQRIHARSGQPFMISRDAVELCCGYDWPGNVTELEHAMQRACTLSKDGVITIGDLPAPIQRLHAGADLVIGFDEPSAAPVEIPAASAVRLNNPMVPTLLSVAESSPGESLVPLKQFLRGQELTYLHHTLAQVGGSKERAAELLGISLATIYRKLSEPECVS